jgi:hypothetical protein
MIGIPTYYKKTADQVIANNTPVTVGLLSPIAANQTQKFRAWIPITVGATGGVRVIVIIPAGASIINSVRVNNTVADAVTLDMQAASAAIGNALANAGTHWVEIEGLVINGATAGSIDVQVAQNTTDALTLTVEAGANMQVIAG